VSWLRPNFGVPRDLFVRKKRKEETTFGIRTELVKFLLLVLRLLLRGGEEEK
jgi:hypothetical protein